MGQGGRVRLVILATMMCSVMGIITDNEDLIGKHRTRRYAPRLPLAYMNKVNPILEDYGAVPTNNFYTKRFMLGRDLDLGPVSHFREFRQSQQNSYRNRPDATLPAQDPLSPYRRNTRRFTGPITKTGRSSSQHGDATGLEDFTPLSDEEIQTIILLLNGYALSSKGGNPGGVYNNDDDALVPTTPEQYYNPSYLSPDDLRRLAKVYATNKRESGQGRFFDLEQPASLDNEDPDKIEFLSSKRSKRVGIHHLTQEPSGRFKKETNPHVVAQLEKVFNGPKALPLSISNDKGRVTTDKAVVTSTHSGNSGSSSSSSSGQIPAPGHVQGMGNNKAKKSIDWSDYFGIDKKSSHDHDATIPAVESTKSNKHNEDEENTKDASTPKLTAQQEPTTAPISAVKPKVIVPARITEPVKPTLKESKEHKKLRVREENETENKSDRKWILNEFYKNLAMSTNVKRKRETNEADDLSDLEQKMAAAGDDIIWDALKYAGAHKDEPLSPIELAQVKKEIIEKLAAAYNLEKIREAIEEFREQLMAMKTNNV